VVFYLNFVKWINFVKTSCKKELSPYNPDWLYVRAGNYFNKINLTLLIAALARKVYLRHNIGIGSLKHIYGGKWRRGVRTPRHGACSKKVIRYCL
jgi:small subunit ribosomal protein S19e